MRKLALALNNVYADTRRQNVAVSCGPQPGDAVAPAEAQPDPPQAPEPETPPQPAPMLANDAPSPNLDQNALCLTATRILQEALNRVPLANPAIFDARLDTTSPFRLPSYPKIGRSARRRR